VLADELRRASSAELPVFLSLQELRRSRSTWLTRKLITFDDALAGKYVEEYAAMSYRWETPEHPDPSGMQLRALQEYLRQRPRIRFVFVDFMCLAQGSERSPRDKAEFGTMLPNINLLYLGCSVICVMFDETYMQRFWPQFEAWLTFMQASESGLVSTPEENLRCSIECLGDTPVWYANALKDRWLHRDAAGAHHLLSKPWVEVTNQSDKEVQLYKISHLDFMVRRHFTKRGQVLAKPMAPSGSSACSDGTGGNTLLSAATSVEGLSTLLKDTRLEDRMDAASAWCDEQGFDAVDEILATSMEEAFVAALSLKPGKQMVLLKALQSLKATI